MCCASLVALTQCWQTRGEERGPSVPVLHILIFPPLNSLLQKATSQHSFPRVSHPKLEQFSLNETYPASLPVRHSEPVSHFITQNLTGCCSVIRSPIASRQVSWVHAIFRMC